MSQPNSVNDFGNSKVAIGDPDGIKDVIERTRRFHEIHPAVFPPIKEIRWFADGLYLISDEAPAQLFQVPMLRVEDLIIPQEYPNLPKIGKPQQ